MVQKFNTSSDDVYYFLMALIFAYFIYYLSYLLQPRGHPEEKRLAERERVEESLRGWTKSISKVFRC